MRPLLAWFRRPRPGPAEIVRQALAKFRDVEADGLDLLRDLVDALRPRDLYDEGELFGRLGMLVGCMEVDRESCAAFRRHFVRFLTSRRLVSFFSDSGILPGTGFFSEWWRILRHRLLPEVPDVRQLKDCAHVLFNRRSDWMWIAKIPPEMAGYFWRLLAPAESLSPAQQRYIRGQVQEAILVLAQRVSGLAVETSLLRATPDLENFVPRFMRLSIEAVEFTRFAAAGPPGAGPEPESARRLLMAIRQCRDALLKVKKHALTVGTTLHLTYSLIRAEQSLRRMAELVTMLSPPPAADPQIASTAAWTDFAHEAFVAENRRHSLANYWAQLSRLLALRVTENAARSGERYICETRADYRSMWLSAMGAGMIIAGMALIKIYAGKLGAPLFVEAFMFSLNYGLGFVLIYLLGFTIATKQPAMTAQTLASHLSGLKPDRVADRERLVDLVAAVSRSQLAAIVGNVSIAFPTAIGLGLALGAWNGATIIPPAKAARLVADLDPLGRALPHAAIAGFYLYLSGLITGYFDNRATCTKLGARVERLPWLVRLVGRRRAQAVGHHLESHFGGIMGNFLFGCMLGSTATIGVILGLPLDIRHITFAAANLGYALVGFDFDMPAEDLLWAGLGVLGIGLTNLLVSFVLALRTALGARRVKLSGHTGALFAAIARRLNRHPRLFLLPPRRDSAPG